MKQITRDLYTSGRVWLSLSHSFTQSSDDNSFDLIKVNGDFVTLNAGALFVLSLWVAGKRTPEKFYIPEYKIEEFRMILSTLNDLKEDERYIRNGELTEAGKASNLYYRLLLNNKKYMDVYFVENDYNGDKSINIALEITTKDNGNVVCPMYPSNVTDLIDVIPRPSEIVRYKQSAAELYYLENFVMGSAQGRENNESTTSKSASKKSAPRTINKVDRTSVSKETISYVVETPNKEEETVEKEPETPSVPNTESQAKTIEEGTNKSGYDYSKLLEDE